MFYLQFKKHEKIIKNYRISIGVSIKKLLLILVVLSTPVRIIYDIAFVISDF